MLDDLRNSSSFEDEDENFDELEDEEVETSARGGRRDEPFLGMTAPQRFVVVLMVFLMTFVLGALALVVLGKIYLPFF